MAGNQGPSERHHRKIRQRHRGCSRPPKRNRLNGTRRPKSLLSGLLFCGLCGGPYTLRGSDRFACSSHVTNGSCTNSRTIPRPDLERRVLTPGPNRGEIDAMLYGELGTILNWIERQAIGKSEKRNTPGAMLTGVSVSVVAGARNQRKLLLASGLVKRL
nr:zinc ribbon domain-containing protein [Gluconobacter oxydans]